VDRLEDRIAPASRRRHSSVDSTDRSSIE
jgi:hypothetical protein